MLLIHQKKFGGLFVIGVSACLLGENCTYSGKSHPIAVLQQLYQEGQVIAVCPEVMGGLLIPRNPAEIQSEEPLLIQTNQNQDVTKEYIDGAKKALQLFLDNDVKVAVLKFRSPSCGCEGIYDGTFTHTLIEGQGVFARMCQKHNIKLFHENQIVEFLKYIGKEDVYGTYFKD